MVKWPRIMWILWILWKVFMNAHSNTAPDKFVNLSIKALTFCFHAIQYTHGWPLLASIHVGRNGRLHSRPLQLKWKIRLLRRLTPMIKGIWGRSWLYYASMYIICALQYVLWLHRVPGNLFWFFGDFWRIADIFANPIHLSTLIWEIFEVCLAVRTNLGQSGTTLSR